MLLVEQNINKDLLGLIRESGLESFNSDDLFFDNHIHPNFKDIEWVKSRLIISIAVIRVIKEPKKNLEYIAWLKQEFIWNHLSEKEKRFFERDFKKSNELSLFFNYIEHAYLLAWSIDLLDTPPNFGSALSVVEINVVCRVVPKSPDSTGDFFMKNHKLKKEKILFLKNYYKNVKCFCHKMIDLNGNPPENIDLDIVIERENILNEIVGF